MFPGTKNLYHKVLEALADLFVIYWILHKRSDIPLGTNCASLLVIFAIFAIQGILSLHGIHVEKVNITNRNLGCIFRSFTYIDKEMFLHLFKSLVRPHLEYVSVIFSPALKKDQIMLENVQKACYQIGKSTARKTYSERLKSLGLPSLQYRSLRNDMVQTYKIVRDIDIVDKVKLFTIVTETRTRADKYKLFKRRSRLNICKNVLSNSCRQLE